jgi:hypothetical protein
MDMTQTQNNTVRFYEGSYQYKTISTHLNISPDFIQMQLAKQFEYRATNESLWAEVIVHGVTSRFELDYHNIKLIQLF